MTTSAMPIVTRPIAARRRGITYGPMVDAAPYRELIYAAYRLPGQTWTRLSMACDVSVDTLRKIACGRKSYIQSATAYRLRRLLALLPDEEG